MTTGTHKETSNIERDGLTLTRLLCFSGAAILLLSALYLLFGSFFFADTSHLFVVDAALLTFGDTILFAVIIGAMAFFFWLAAYGGLICLRMVCASCHHDLSEVPCPECGKIRKSTLSRSNQMPMKKDRMGQGRLPVGTLRLIRFIGACILSFSVFYLFLGGVIHHLYVPILRVIPYFTDDGKIQTELSVAIINCVDYFPGSVPLVVLVGLVGFFIWFIPYRRLARAWWLCPSCRYDLSALPCPKCNEVPATE